MICTSFLEPSKILAIRALSDPKHSAVASTIISDVRFQQGGEYFFVKLMMLKGTFTRVIFCYDMFFFFIDVKDWINNNCSECVLSHLNICDWFIRTHPSKG